MNTSLLWGEYKSTIHVKRAFAKKFGVDKHPRLVPPEVAFKRVVDRFVKTGSVQIVKQNRPKTIRTPENVQRVKNLVDRDMSLSVYSMSLELDISQTSVWRILRRDLNHYQGWYSRNQSKKYFVWEVYFWGKEVFFEVPKKYINSNLSIYLTWGKNGLIWDLCHKVMVTLWRRYIFQKSPSFFATGQKNLTS